MKVFISGPMTGHKNFNRRKFRRMERELRKRGYIVLSPAVLPNGLTHGAYLHICLGMIDCCDGVMFLEGWERSIGACKEHEYAETKGIKRFYERDWR